MMALYTSERERMDQFDDETRNMQPAERFDRISFAFETNIDIVEELK